MAPLKPALNKDGGPLAEQFFTQVSESIQMIFDLTSRVDERVKMLFERQKEVDDHVDKLITIQQESIGRLGALEARDIAAMAHEVKKISERIAIMESNDPKKEVEKLHLISNEIKNNFHAFELKMEALSLKVVNHDNQWTQIFDAVWKVTLMIIAGYILYKLGLQAPPS